jgi:hypothetical protein
VQLLVLSCDYAWAIAYQPALAQPREAATRAVEHDERGVRMLVLTENRTSERSERPKDVRVDS